MQKNIDTLKIDNGDRTLVHFHGFSSCKEENKTLIDFCKQNSITYCGIDFPGQGNSSIDERDKPDLEYFAKIAVNYIKSLNKKDIIISGHSMGGAIALLASSILGKDIVSHIILEDPLNHSLLDSEKDRINLLNLLKAKDSHLKLVDGNIVDEEMNDKERSWYKKLAENITSHELLEQLQKVTSNLKIKIDVIFGVNDSVIPYKNSLKGFKSIQTSNPINFHDVENAKHSPHNENPEKYLTIIGGLI